VKVGVVVEGQSEFTALPHLREQICCETAASSLRILHACYDPHGRPERVVKGCRSAVKQLAGRKFDLAVVLIDRERQTKGSAEIARVLEAAFLSADLGIPVSVVVKDRCFENWLVADLGALRRLNARFEVSTAMAKAIEPDRADRVDAAVLLKRAARGDAYGKVDDARRILEKATIARIAGHSRSFRCFLARLGHPELQDGSCSPVTA
jgi:hypothetical protein